MNGIFQPKGTAQRSCNQSLRRDCHKKHEKSQENLFVPFLCFSWPFKMRASCANFERLQYRGFEWFSPSPSLPPYSPSQPALSISVEWFSHRWETGFYCFRLLRNPLSAGCSRLPVRVRPARIPTQVSLKNHRGRLCPATRFPERPETAVGQ